MRMKTLWLTLLITLGSGIGYSWPMLSWLDTPALSNDPVFNRVLMRRVIYPARAIRSATYGRIYAGFDIDASGHLQNVSILGPQNTGAGFEYEISEALKRMPPLNPRYRGRYALPVSFVLTNWGESSEPRTPTGLLSARYLTDRVLLDEVIFRGGLRPIGGYIPPSQEIKYY